MSETTTKDDLEKQETETEDSQKNEQDPPRVVHLLICDSVSASTATKTTNEK